MKSQFPKKKKDRKKFWNGKKSNNKRNKRTKSLKPWMSNWRPRIRKEKKRRKIWPRRTRKKRSLRKKSKSWRMQEKWKKKSSDKKSTSFNKVFPKSSRKKKKRTKSLKPWMSNWRGGGLSPSKFTHYKCTVSKSEDLRPNTVGFFLFRRPRFSKCLDLSLLRRNITTFALNQRYCVT